MRAALALLILLGLTVGAAWWRMLVGPAGLRWPDDPIVFDLRSVRVGAGAATGAALAVAGVLLQTLLRNPLASPDLLGLSSGAAAGAMTSIYGGFVATGVIATQSLAQGPAALLGAALALAVVFALSQRRGLIDPVSMILVGVIVSIIASAAVMLLRHLLPDGGQSTGRWLIGSISDDAPTSAIWLALVLTVATLAVGVVSAPTLDAGAFGEDEARSVGVRISRVRALLFLAAGALSGVAVWLAGPVGFVGLVCPHAVRLAAGPGHRVLLPGSALAGAALVVGADAAIASLHLASGRLPLGVVTSLLGGPVFLALLVRERGRAT